MSRPAHGTRPPLARTAALAAAALVAACQSTAPSDAIPMTPSAQFTRWWQETERCAGRTAPMERVRWYLVEGNGFACPSGFCAARWEPDHRIFLAARWREHEMVVRHEMLHDILGGGGHPDPPFRRGCGLTWDSWREGTAGSGGTVGVDVP